MSVKRGIGTKKRYVVAKGRDMWRDADAQHMMTALGKKVLEDSRSILGKNIAEIVATSPPRLSRTEQRMFTTSTSTRIVPVSLTSAENVGRPPSCSETSWTGCCP